MKIIKTYIKKYFLLVLLCSPIGIAFGQKTHQDSVIAIARADAKLFRMDDTLWKKYRHKLPYTSDYFKPNASVVKDTALLNDSVYVDAYRKAAFKQHKHRRTPWHYVLVGGEIVAATAAAFITAVIIFVAPKMGG